MIRRLWDIPAVRYTLCILVALVLGAAFGRWGTPPKTVVREVERVVTKVEYKDRVVIQQAKARVVFRDIVRTVTVTAAGTTTTTTTDHSRVDTTTHTDTTETTAGSSTGTRDSSRVSITTARPSWRLGVLLGVGLLAPDGLIRTQPVGTLPAAPLGPAYVGVETSGQVFGPVFVGGWALTNGRDVMLGASTGINF